MRNLVVVQHTELHEILAPPETSVIYFPALESCQGITLRVCSKTPDFFSLSDDLFHDKTKNSSDYHMRLISSSVSAMAISVDLHHSMYPPTCAIHALFLACLDNVLYICRTSSCYMCCVLGYNEILFFDL